MEIPKWLNGLATSKDLDAIQEAVLQAEKTTSGEIVPMIVHRSITTGHVQPMVTQFLFILIVALFILLTPSMEGLQEHTVLAIALFLALVLIPLALGFFLSRFDEVQRWFTKAEDREISAIRRANLEFHETGIPDTEGRTGILIFVSLVEHQAVVLGDHSIAEKIKPEVWTSIVDGMIAKIRSGDFKGAYVEAIHKVGEILAKEFPLRAGDRNELANKLVVQE